MASNPGPPENQSLVGKFVSELRDMKDRGAKEEGIEEEVNPFAHLDKSSVIQDCKVFHDATFVRLHPKRCCGHLTSLLYLVCAGARMREGEAEGVFFGVTKLFQSTDGNLRRLVYLFLRTIAETTDSSSLIIVTQSLVKDMFNDVPLYKGNALRVLASIVDASMLSQLERYFKQMIVDKDDYVASAALTSSLLLLNTRPGTADVIARWVNEVQTVLTTRSDMVQFHALALLRCIKKHDRLAVSKVVQQLMKGAMRSPLGVCLLIRYTQTLLAADPSTTAQASMLDFLESCMRHKSEMVVFEAARAVVALPGVTARDLGPALTMLHMFLASPKPALRFAAVRTLHTLAASHAIVVSKCNDDLETLISDSNRSIATLAVTTLLKTGSESSVDRLMKQISSFMAEVGSDELKVTVVQAIHELALRLPSKHRAIMSFLSNALREEGGFDFKKAILDGLLDIMEVIPDAKNEGLLHLCEFIEDCEFATLASRVLHLLGDQGPSAPQPSVFIRFIYNRVILENAQVRASAVTALAKFATRVEELRPSIMPLLARCLADDDDEVRDRATMYLTMLGGQVGSTSTPVDARLTKSVTAGRLPHSIGALQKALQLYQLRPAAGAFSFDTLPHVESTTAATLDGEGGYGYTSEIRAAEAAAAATKIARARAKMTTSAIDAATAGSSGSAAGGGSSSGGGGSAGGAADAAAEALYKVPEFAAMGSLFRSSKPKELTEAELEYLVTVVKHVFAEHVVFQFTIRNTVADVVLERATIAMTPSEPAMYTHIASIAAARVKEGVPATAYVAFKREADAGFGSCNFECELRFASREYDAAAGEPVGDATPEEYPVDGVDVTPADFVAPVVVPEFRGAWEALGGAGEVLEQYALPIKSVADAVNLVTEALGLAACEGTGSVKTGVPKHNAYLSGVFVGGVKVLARMQVSLDGDTGVVLKLGIRAEDRTVSQLLMDCVA